MNDYNNFKSYLDNMIFYFDESWNNAMQSYNTDNQNEYQKGYADGHEEIKNILIEQLKKLIDNVNEINIDKIVYLLVTSNMEAPCKIYLNKLIPILIKRGIEIKKITTKGDGYNSGLGEAYYEILDRMKNWAESYSIDEAEIGIEKINPDQDL